MPWAFEKFYQYSMFMVGIKNEMALGNAGDQVGEEREGDLGVSKDPCGAPCTRWAPSTVS